MQRMLKTVHRNVHNSPTYVRKKKSRFKSNTEVKYTKMNICAVGAINENRTRTESHFYVPLYVADEIGLVLKEGTFRLLISDA